RWLEQWMYPIDKTDLDVLRFAHFLALATVTVRFLPKDWPGLKSRWLRPLILCGQHSLEIFCLGVFLAFAGHFILAEVSGGAGLHFVVSVSGILIMSGAAWLFSWYKYSADKSASRTRSTMGNADMAGGSL
ncbi:MAG: OpgC domain-containing protein, partial [Terriglobia bacterium]